MTSTCDHWQAPSAEQIEHALKILERCKPYANGFAAQSMIQFFVPMLRAALVPPTDHDHMWASNMSGSYCLQCGWPRNKIGVTRE